MRSAPLWRSGSDSCKMAAQCVSWSKIGDGYKFAPTVEVCERHREFMWTGNLMAGTSHGLPLPLQAPVLSMQRLARR